MSTADTTTSNAPVLPVVGVSPKRWTREEYYRLAEEGLFEGQRVELMGGQIVVMSPQSYPHYFSSDEIAELLRGVFGPGYWVRHQAPMTIPNDGEPEPDVSVVTGTKRDYTDHPRTAVLVVEVAKTSLDYDTKTKAHAYASAGVPDYWVLDLINRQLIVHRDPVADRKVEFGYRYKSITTVDELGSVSPLEHPDAEIAVAQMLPPNN